MFKAFLGYTEDEVKALTMRKYIDSIIVLDEVLRYYVLRSFKT